MSQIQNDPERLRAFVSQLESFRSNLQDQLNSLGTAMSRLGDTWRDRGYSEFKDEFMRTRIQVKKFIDETQAVTPKLKDAAEQLDRMDKVRLR